MTSVNFIKNLIEGKNDSHTHRALIRYGLGEYDQEPMTIKLGKQIKIQGNFEFVNVLVRFVLRHTDEDLKISGGIPAMEDISSELKKFGAEEVERKTVRRLKQKMHVFKATMTPEICKKFEQAFGDRYLLLNIASTSRQLKIKKIALPDLRSDTTKYVTLTLPDRDKDIVLDTFLFDVKDRSPRSCTISHRYEIKEIVVDEKLVQKDPAAARAEAKRKGILMRTIDCDGSEIKKEYPFEA